MCSPNEKQVLENSVSIADAPHPRKRSNQSKQEQTLEGFEAHTSSELVVEPLLLHSYYVLSV